MWATRTPPPRTPLPPCPSRRPATATCSAPDRPAWAGPDETFPPSTGVEVANTLPGGNMDVFVVSSRDGGETWSQPVRVNDDLGAPANGQWMTAIAVGPEGTVHTTWLDYRDDPSGQWAYVYYAYSVDHGYSWSVNARVSDVPFDGEGGYHQSGAGTIGDYMGLAVSEEAVHPFWADTRNERNDVFGAIIPAR